MKSMQNKNKYLAAAFFAGISLAGLSQAQAGEGLHQVMAKAQSDCAKMKYPIVFTHGMFGFTVSMRTD